VSTVSREAPKSIEYFLYFSNSIAALGIAIMFWARIFKQSNVVILGLFLMTMGLMGLAYCYYWAQREMHKEGEEETEEVIKKPKKLEDW